MKIHDIGRVQRRDPVRIVVAISGPVRAGKSTLASELAKHLGAHVTRTKQVLVDEYGGAPEVRQRRARLQQLGEKLDDETDGRWVAEAVKRDARALPWGRPVVVDAVRIKRQLDWLREVPGFHVIHIHVSAGDETLARRYADGVTGAGEEFATYAEVRANETEARVPDLARLTRLRVNTSVLPRRGAAFAAAASVRAIRTAIAMKELGVALAYGAPIAAILLAPTAWFLSDWDVFGKSLYLLSAIEFALFAVSAVLIGTALTHLSPIERDPPPVSDPGQDA